MDTKNYKHADKPLNVFRNVNSLPPHFRQEQQMITIDQKNMNREIDTKSINLKPEALPFIGKLLPNYPINIYGIPREIQERMLLNIIYIIINRFDTRSFRTLEQMMNFPGEYLQLLKQAIQESNYNFVNRYKLTWSPQNQAFYEYNISDMLLRLIPHFQAYQGHSIS